MANREDALKEVISKKPELVKKMMDCPEPSKLVALLKDNGIEITELEASKILRAINFYEVTSDVDDKGTSKPKKLDDKDLDNTSGGSVLAWVKFANFAWSTYQDYKKQKNNFK